MHRAGNTRCTPGSRRSSFTDLLTPWVEELDQMSSDRLGRVLLEEVPGFGDELQLRLRDPRMEPVRRLHRYPSVRLAPEDEDRSAYLAVERLDLVGEALVGLGDLAVERILSSSSQPGLHVRGERGGAQLAVGNAAEGRRDDRLVERCRQLL